MSELFKCKRCRRFMYDTYDYCEKCIEELQDEWTTNRNRTDGRI